MKYTTSISKRYQNKEVNLIGQNHQLKASYFKYNSLLLLILTEDDRATIMERQYLVAIVY